jgi:hypothetical protein
MSGSFQQRKSLGPFEAPNYEGPPPGSRLSRNEQTERRRRHSFFGRGDKANVDVIVGG